MARLFRLRIPCSACNMGVMAYLLSLHAAEAFVTGQTKPSDPTQKPGRVLPLPSSSAGFRHIFPRHIWVPENLGLWKAIFQLELIHKPSQSGILRLSGLFINRLILAGRGMRHAHQFNANRILVGGIANARWLDALSCVHAFWIPALIEPAFFRAAAAFSLASTFQSPYVIRSLMERSCLVNRAVFINKKVRTVGASIFIAAENG